MLLGAVTGMQVPTACTRGAHPPVDLQQVHVVHLRRGGANRAVRIHQPCIELRIAR